MNKKLVLWLIVTIMGISIVGLGGYLIFRAITREDGNDLFCAEAGESSSNASLGPEYYYERECCSGLVEISNELIYNPESEYADEKGCELAPGGGRICSDCGNGNCEEWENFCNCPKDCKN